MNPELYIALLSAAGAGVVSTILNLYFKRGTEKASVMQEQVDTISKLWQHTRELEQENERKGKRIRELQETVTRLEARIGRLSYEMAEMKERRGYNENS